jgi:hypothetical protein
MEKETSSVLLFQSLFPDNSCFLGVTNLTKDDVLGILSKWLSTEHRSLTDDQHTIFLQATTQCPVPLYVQLCFDEARRWHSYDSFSLTVLRSTIESTIDALFERIEREHGRVLVQHALAFLTGG